MSFSIEYTAVLEADALRRAFAGFIRLCLHGRLQCSDGNCLVGVDADEVSRNAEAVMLGNKTPKGKEKQKLVSCVRWAFQLPKKQCEFAPD